MSRGIVLAHITDTHIACDGRATAVLKDRSIPILHDLVSQVLDRRVDGVLFGGDNIDNRETGYRDLEVFASEVARIPKAVCVAGNHESDTARPGRVSQRQFAMRLADLVASEEVLQFSVAFGDVRVIGIDTTLAGSTGGYVSPRSMRFLAGALAEAREDKVVVLGHHLLHRPWEPYHFDGWDKDYLVANRDAVIALLASHPNVRAYLCGHHHASRIQRIASRGAAGGFYHILTPSTAAFPHVARVIEFGVRGMTVTSLRPRLPGLVEAGRAAVLTGRKAMRYLDVGAARTFIQYVQGRSSDNDVFLPYDRAPEAFLPPMVSVERRGQVV